MDSPFERAALRKTWIDHRIEEARSRGLFDDLEGVGQPLGELAEVADPSWWGKKLLRRERVSLLPASLEIRRRVERVVAGLVALHDERKVRSRLARLNEEIRRVNSRTVSGPNTQVAMIDVEKRLGEWRAAHETKETT